MYIYIYISSSLTHLNIKQKYVGYENLTWSDTDLMIRTDRSSHGEV